MVNNVIKLSFTVIGAVTGFTITRIIFTMQGINIPQDIKFAIYIVVVLVTAILFYSTATKIIDSLLNFLNKLDYTI
ncbi:MAG TPA: PIN/TRAM domain-containing protein, partial [Clostridiales bacterium]|nr:PIN/TRAM domain-containing protein [Clostridiales bacterium]